MNAIRRIDTPEAAYQLRRALAEHTGGNVTAVTMKPVQTLEDGIMKRHLAATVDGERKRFVAVAANGKVGIYDARFDLQPKQIHQLLAKVESHQLKTPTKANGWPVRSPTTASLSNAHIRRR